MTDRPTFADPAGFMRRAAALMRQSPPPTPENPGSGMVWIMALRLAGEYLDTVEDNAVEGSQGD